jgi:hypothetical protein
VEDCQPVPLGIDLLGLVLAGVARGGRRSAISAEDTL